MVEPENVNDGPVMFGVFILDMIFIYCAGMAFWSTVFWAVDGRCEINSPKVINSAHMVVLPIMLGYAFLYLIDKMAKRGGKN